MPETDDLHELVHALDQGEKRYFKVRAGQHTIGEKNNSVRLFDALAAQGVYDEEKLLRQFEGEGLARNLASEKTYLHKLILRAMRGYHEERSADNELRNLLMDLRFLNGKRLYRPFLKTLRKAKKLAIKFERFPVVLEILLLEREFAKEMEDRDLETSLAELHETSRQAMASLSDLWNHVEVFDRNFLLVRKAFRLRGDAPLQELADLKAEPILRPGSAGKSFHAHLYVHLLNAFACQMEGKREETLRHHRLALAEWERHPHEIADDPFNYIKSVSNFLAACHLADNYPAMPALLEKVAQLQPPTAKGKLEQFNCLHHFALIHAFNTADFSRLGELGASLEEGLERYDRQFSQARKFTYRYNLFVLHFIQEHFSEALKWVNAIVHDRDSNHRQDIQSAARILLLILHYELGNEDLITYLSRGVYRYLSLREELHAFESAVLNWLRTLRNRKPGDPMLDYFRDLDQALTGVAENPSQRNVAGLEEVRLWLGSKLRKTKILEELGGRMG